ncbi:helix-turn-helix transcriptional regulator [Salmonella enterica]|nr:helix-turn-helix transcriptional regulator [Salmonella enterica]
MARPKSEDKKQALLEAATQAIAQSGIAASTAAIARNAGVAEGTLFRYFATKETEKLADDMFPELRDLCHRSVLMVFMSDEYRAFGDGLFLALAETTMDFATRDPARAGEFIALGFEAMWRALTREEQ